MRSLCILIVLFSVILLYHNGAVSAQCRTIPRSGCSPSCPNQLLIKVSPKSHAIDACTLLSGPPNDCCLLGQTGPSGADFVYQNWCCLYLPPSNRTVQDVIDGISGVSYITLINKKRAYENDPSQDKHKSMYLFTYFLIS